MELSVRETWVQFLVPLKRTFIKFIQKQKAENIS